MPIYISSELVLEQAQAGNANQPIIGYHNLVTVANITTTEEDIDHPKTNLANPLTHVEWRGETTDPQDISVLFSYDGEVGYIGIARHNWGSAQIPVTIYVAETAPLGVPDWVELFPEHLLANDKPLMYLFTPTTLVGVKISLGEGLEIPRAAVMYVGEALRLERNIYVGHTPLPYGRRRRKVNGVSWSGNYLGSIILGSHTETGFTISNMTAGWYRTYLDPFVEVQGETPFFFAWRPSTYPSEVGYAWITNEPEPVNDQENGMMKIDFQMRGIVK